MALDSVQAARVTIGVLVEADLRLHGCGVALGDELMSLARGVMRLPHL